MRVRCRISLEPAGVVGLERRFVALRIERRLATVGRGKHYFRAGVLERIVFDLAQTRLWIRSGRKIRIRYRDEHGRESERTIWPTIIGYAATVRLLAAWCELRREFRHFRTDRILAAGFLEERHGCRPGELRTQWKRTMEAKRGISLP